MVIPKMKTSWVFTAKQKHLLELAANSERLLLRSEIMSECCEILSESISVLRFQTPCDISHELIETLREPLLLLYRLQQTGALVLRPMKILC